LALVLESPNSRTSAVSDVLTEYDDELTSKKESKGG